MTEITEIKELLKQAQSYTQSISSIEIFYEHVGKSVVFEDAVIKPRVVIKYN